MLGAVGRTPRRRALSRGRGPHRDRPSARDPASWRQHDARL